MTSLRLPIILVYLILVMVALLALDIFQSLLVALLIAALGAVVLWELISRSIMRPLGDISDEARTIATGDYNARVRPRPPGEVGDLADAFNAMAGQVQAQMSSAAQERSRLAAALNSSIDAVVAAGADGRVLFANIAAERLFQRPATEIIDNPFAWTLANDQIIDAVRTSQEHGQSSVSIIERPGRRYLQVVTTPIIGGGDWAVLVVFHDLTDVKRTEQVRRDFVANVSHELRTPLAAIKSVIETLVGGALDDRPVAQDFLDRADADVDRLIQLVEELLELSRIESGDLPLVLQPTDVIALLEDVVERLRPQAERKRLSLNVAPSKGLDLVALDAARVERAVTNLVHNAIKFTPDGGSITVFAHRSDAKLTISVSDTGIGIANEDLPRIFERFYKVDQSRSSLGRGIGLAIVKHTVEAHGGSVQAESALGRGSTFSFSLPA